MLRTTLLILLLFTWTASLGQLTVTRDSFFRQFIEEVNFDAPSYKRIVFDGHPLRWDTADFVYKKYLTAIDTADTNDLAVKHRPTKRRIIAFMALIDDGDYAGFIEQVLTQTSGEFPFPMIIKGGRKKKEILTISLSQPLVTADQKKLIIQEIRKTNSSYSRYTRVYVRTENRWKIWDTLKAATSSY